jgi:hypothetical protein
MKMTKAESEALFFDAVHNDETRCIIMTKEQTCSFRVHVHRIMKEMEKKNHTLWLRAKNFGISRVGDETIISKAKLNAFKVYRYDEDGNKVLVVRNDTDENGYKDIEVDDLGEVALEVIKIIPSTEDGVNCRYCKNKVCLIKQKYMKECDDAGKDTLEEIKMVVCSKWEKYILPKI